MESPKQWMRESLTFKLLSMGLIIVLLIIPSVIIAALIDERSNTADEATEEVSQKWGHEQLIVGPMLMVPFKEPRMGTNGDVAGDTRHAYFLPSSLAVNGELIPSIRYRGVYEVTVYTANLEFSGSFDPPSFVDWEVDGENILWNEASMIVGIRDMRGINEVMTLDWNGANHTFGAGLDADGVVSTGVSTRVDAAQGGDFAFDLSLNGSRSIQVVPRGQGDERDHGVVLDRSKL